MEIKKSLIFFLFFIQCCNIHKTENNQELIVLDFEQALKNERKDVPISEIADTVEYLILQTPKEIIISGIRKVIFFEKYLYILTKGSGFYLFTKDGHFVCKIGSKGRGPGEYTMIRDFTIDKIKREVVISGGERMLNYSLDGKYLSTRMGVNRSFFISSTDTILWCTSSSSIFEKNITFAINSQNDTITRISNPLFGKSSYNGNNIVINNKIEYYTFYSFSNNFFYKESINCELRLIIRNSKKKSYKCLHLYFFIYLCNHVYT